MKFFRGLGGALLALALLGQAGCATASETPKESTSQQTDGAKAPKLDIPEATVDFECGELSMLITALGRLETDRKDGAFDEATLQTQEDLLYDMWLHAVVGETAVSKPFARIQQAIKAENFDDISTLTSEASELCSTNGSGIMSMGLPGEGG